MILSIIVFNALSVCYFDLSGFRALVLTELETTSKTSSAARAIASQRGVSERGSSVEYLLRRCGNSAQALSTCRRRSGKGAPGDVSSLNVTLEYLPVGRWERRSAKSSGLQD